MASSMAMKSEFDFVEPPPEEFFCPVSLAVLLEPYLTPCCGAHLSQEAYQRLQGQPCPMCREENLTGVLDKSVKRKVLSLKVRCPHRAEGCEWQGELRSLEQHLNTNSSEEGGCKYVGVDCPYACGERVQRRSLEEHKSQHCPLRPFTCQYCSHTAAFQAVTEEHWPVCEKYPLQCPYECGEEEMERKCLKEHLEQTCPLEVIQCEFSYAGCGAQLQRRLMSAHKKENVEAHLSMLSLVAQEVPKLQSIVQQQADLIKQITDQMKQDRDQMKQDRDQMKQDRDQIKQQGDQIKHAFMKLQVGKLIPPVEIIMNDFEKHKKADDIWCSPPFCSHLGGYKMSLKVRANGLGDGKGTHMSVYIRLMKGEFDDFLKWPLQGEVTVQLKKAKPPHYEQIVCLDHNTPIRCVCKPTEMNPSWGKRVYISHADLYAGGYIKDDKLVFCVSDVLIMSK